MKQFKVYSFFLLDSEEFDQLTKEVYGQNYDFVPSEEASNGSYKAFLDVKKEKLNGYDKKKLDEWKSGGTVDWLADVLLTDMCNQDIIPPGNYLVRTFW